MLENLISLVKEQAGDAVINNPAVPNEHNDAVIAETGNSITSGLQNMLSRGGIKDVMNLFGGQNNDVSSSPVTQHLSGGVIENLMNKFGLDKQAAGGIAAGLVPSVLQKLVSKTNDPNDSSFDLQGVFNSLSGGKTQGMNIQNLVGKFTQGGLDKDGDGDTDLQDVMAMFSGNGQNSSSITEAAKGLFN